MRNIGIRALVVASLSLVFTGACASKSNGGDSETNWLACKTSADCHGGQTCENERCVDEITLADGGLHTISNPTGDCVANGSGARLGYHAPDPGDVWLPDCKNFLLREYYRVFAKSPTSAYVVPRPDGAPELEDVCTDPSHELRPLVEKYSLCSGATDAATVAKINAMIPEEALTLTHYMHQRLVFMHVPNAVVAPFGIPSDLLDACALHPDRNSQTLQTTCTQAASATEPVDGTGFFASADEIVRLLNELYGIGNCGSDTIPVRTCLQCGSAGGCAHLAVGCSTLCSVEADCASSPGGPTCFSGTCQQSPPCD